MEYPNQQPQYNAVTDEVNPIHLGKFRPLSPWAYYGYTLLFSIPVVGFVFLIVFSFNDSNRNRRNFARSYWCALIVALIVAVVWLLIMLIIAAATGASLSGLFEEMKIY